MANIMPLMHYHIKTSEQIEMELIPFGAEAFVDFLILLCLCHNFFRFIFVCTIEDG